MGTLPLLHGAYRRHRAEHGCSISCNPEIAGDGLLPLFPGIYRFLLNKWYFDELYDFLFVTPGQDDSVISSVEILGRKNHRRPWPQRRGAGDATLSAGRTSAALQTGYIYHYAFAMLLGFLAIVSWVVLQ